MDTQFRWRAPIKGNPRRDLHVRGTGREGLAAIVFPSGQWYVGWNDQIASGKKDTVKEGQAAAEDALRRILSK